MSHYDKSQAKNIFHYHRLVKTIKKTIKRVKALYTTMKVLPCLGPVPLLLNCAIIKRHWFVYVKM